jgi:hypothetical protein
MKLCIQCKHILPGIAGKINENSRCGFDRPTSLVTGLLADIEVLPFAELERRTTGRCSLLATNWESADHVMSEEEELLKGNPL